MKRVLLPVLLLLGLFACRESGSSLTEPVIWNRAHLDRIRPTVAENPMYRDAYTRLIAEADRDLQRENPTVMNKPMTPASGDKHDYMSLSRYYWPNPDTPDGMPYINRDGESNPDLDKYDRNRLGELAQWVNRLSLAHYLSGNEAYTDKAVSMLRSWFVDPETRVNPNLEFAQVIPGRNDGRGRSFGLIDTYSYVEMLDAIALLEHRNALPSGELTAIRDWFSELSHWMITAKNGIDEGNSRNNHSIAYDAQVIRFAMFGGCDSLARAVIEAFPERRLASQVDEDGSQPHELSRTLAYHYVVYNLEHMVDITDMAAVYGIDLYPACNAAIDRAIRWAIQYLGRQQDFPYQQIDNWEGTEYNLARLLYRTSRHAPDAGYRALYERFKSPHEDDMFTLLFLE